MSNVWKQFENLLPKKKQIIGKVLSVNSTDKTSTVQMLSGTNIIVKGVDVAVDKFCLVEDGAVQREVPELPVYDVTIY
ncbi:MAG: hypothetical protein AB7E04_11245 [Desulfobacteraceae bacterium]|jgi:hypothetical protein